MQLIVAVTPAEVIRLRAIYENGLKNLVPGLRLLEDVSAIREVEPHCVGLAAIHSPNTGIVDFQQVATCFGRDVQQLGGDVVIKFGVTKFVQDGTAGVRIFARDGREVLAKNVITCGGLFADRLAEMAGGQRHPPIVCFRGEFLRMKPESRRLVRGLIYPVPDPRFPFLGVHFTKRVDGNVDIGPNAVLAFAREGYRYTDINFRDLAEFLGLKGMRTLLARNWRFAVNEFHKSLVQGAQVKYLRQYVPEVEPSMLETGPSGVRALAMGDDGSLLDDFIFEAPTRNTLHVRNAPSPAATSSITIGREVAARASAQFFS